MATSKKDKFTRYTLTSSVMAFLFMVIPALAFADAGKVIFLIGDAQVMAEDGGVVKAHRGMVLNSGDTIETGKKGQLQIRMDDGGLIAVRPNSSFRIDEFVNNGNVETDKSFFSLVKGGFRSVTGAIGESNKEAYRVNTPIATIGIRGTDYTARLCDGDCSNDDGLYIGVMSGGVTVSNDSGSVDIDPSEYGYVEGMNSDPQLLDDAPGDVLFANATTTETQVASNDVTTDTSDETVIDKTASKEDGSTVNLATVSSSDDLLVATVENLVEEETNVVENTETENTSTVDDTVVEDEVTQTVEPEPEIPPAQQYRNVAFTGHTLAPNGGKEVTENVIYAADSSLETIKITQQDGSVHEFTKQAGVAAVDTGSTSGGEFSWGRWTDMNMTVTDDTGTNVVALTDENSLHWGLSSEYENDIVLPTSGSAVYHVAGGTTPTDNYGGLGVLNTGPSSSLTIDFADQSAALALNIGSMKNPDDSLSPNYDWQLQYALNVDASGRMEGNLTGVTVASHEFNTSGSFDNTSISAVGQLGGSTSGNSVGAPAAALVSYEANMTYDSFELVNPGGSMDYQISGVVGAELVSTAP